MTDPKRILLMIGSPRGKKSTSTALGSHLLELFEEKGLEIVDTIWIGTMLRSPEKIKLMLNTVEKADIIILTAPLYDDCQPYIVIKTMEIIASNRKEQKKISKKGNTKLFSVIVNCAFPEAHHNQTVLRIYRRFTKDVGFLWGGSLAISAGEALRGRYGKSLDEIGSVANRVKKALNRMTSSLSEGNLFEDEVITLIPEILYNAPLFFLGNFFNWLNHRGWVNMAKKKGQDVNARPYG